MHIIRRLTVVLTISFIAAPGVHAQDTTSTYDVATSGTRYLDLAGGKSTFKILLEESNLGGKELEMAEHSFAPGTDIRSHSHGSTEIFYVLSGELEHTVNGERHLLTPGMVGVVRPGDLVIHRVPSEDTPAAVLIIWAPAGEIGRIFGNAPGREIHDAESPRE